MFGPTALSSNSIFLREPLPMPTIGLAKNGDSPFSIGMQCANKISPGGNNDYLYLKIFSIFIGSTTSSAFFGSGESQRIKNRSREVFSHPVEISGGTRGERS